MEDAARLQRPPALSKSIFISFVVLCFVLVVTLLLGMSVIFQARETEDTLKLLHRQAAVLSNQLEYLPDENARIESLKDLSSTNPEMRLTLIESDGQVVFDNQAHVEDLENHGKRPEVIKALETGEGSSTRTSATEGVVQHYVAKSLASGEVLRVAYTRASALSLITNNFWLVTALIAFIVVLSFGASQILSKRLAAPILKLDLDSPNVLAPYTELIPVVRRLSENHEALKSQMEELAQADQMRAEFTANVTHELKTPLASISAAAEMMKDGLVAEGDTKGFAQRIYDESQRLQALVNDILILSRMDASERSADYALAGVREPQNLKLAVEAVLERLDKKIKKAGLTLDVSLEQVQVMGNARLLDEMISNLVENSMRYNKPSGLIQIQVRSDDVHAILSVKDSGIGIPAQDQVNVFKRFYRVDKGRSRERGGTGLGLAIVKHVATFHNAQIHLESELGVGTCVWVEFPKIS